MKKLVMIMLVFCGTLIMASNSLGLPTLQAGYEWNDAPYWTITDKTTANSQFDLYMELAGFESSFGLYTVDDIHSETKNITESFEIFSFSDEEPVDKYSTTQRTVSIRRDSGGTWQITLNKLDESSWIDFDDTFGFYFDVDSDADNVANYSFFSDFTLNSLENDVQHVKTAFNRGTNQVMIYLDDQLNGDRDFNDMVVKANDLAPVPEPGTLLLLGSGLAGLAAAKRRKKS